MSIRLIIPDLKYESLFFSNGNLSDYVAVFDIFKDFHIAGHLPENGVAPVEMGLRRICNKELRTVGIRAGICHR